MCLIGSIRDHHTVKNRQVIVIFLQVSNDHSSCFYKFQVSALACISSCLRQCWPYSSSAADASTISAVRNMAPRGKDTAETSNTGCYLTCTRSLDILRACGQRRKQNKIPYWVFVGGNLFSTIQALTFKVSVLLHNYLVTVKILSLHRKYLKVSQHYNLKHFNTKIQASIVPDVSTLFTFAAFLLWY